MAVDRQPSRSKRHNDTFLLGKASPPGFPTDLIVPPHRGSVIVAHDLAQSAAIGPAAIGPAAIGRKALRNAARRAAALARTQAARAGISLVTTAPGSDQSSPDATPIPTVRIEPECNRALALPPAANARMEPAAQPEVTPGPAVPLAYADLPPARALVVRRQGFVDVIAFALRDSGRRLARWSSARRRADDLKEKLARAEARMRAMESQLAALQALQERVRQSG